MEQIPEDPYKIDDAVLDTFLENLAKTGSISMACKAAGISRTYIYQRRKIDEELVIRMEEAKAEYRGIIEQEIHRRAILGVDKKLYHQGMPVLDYELDDNGQPKLDETGRPIVKGHAFVRSYSDNLLLAHARRHIPEYNERKQVDMKVTGLEQILEEIRPSTGLPSESDDFADSASQTRH